MPPLEGPSKERKTSDVSRNMWLYALSSAGFRTRPPPTANVAFKLAAVGLSSNTQ